MSDDPERITALRQIIQLVEQAFDKIPIDFRVVFMARVIEGMSVEETAALLGLKPETVKTRLHRARLLLRDQLNQQVGPLFKDVFPFGGQRCERVAKAVLQRLKVPN
jgi:RNA polymerase sigma-70 factor, ECF subfamily